MLENIFKLIPNNGSIDGQGVEEADLEEMRIHNTRGNNIRK